MRVILKPIEIDEKPMVPVPVAGLLIAEESHGVNCSYRRQSMSYRDEVVSVNILRLMPTLMTDRQGL